MSQRTAEKYSQDLISVREAGMDQLETADETCGLYPFDINYI